MERTLPALLALKMKEEATSQGMWASSRSWKGQGNGFSPGVSRKECRPANSLSLASEIHFGLLISRTLINLCCFKLLSL